MGVYILAFRVVKLKIVPPGTSVNEKTFFACPFRVTSYISKFADSPNWADTRNPVFGISLTCTEPNCGNEISISSRPNSNTIVTLWLELNSFKTSIFLFSFKVDNANQVSSFWAIGEHLWTCLSCSKSSNFKFGAKSIIYQYPWSHPFG